MTMKKHELQTGQGYIVRYNVGDGPEDTVMTFRGIVSLGTACTFMVFEDDGEVLWINSSWIYLLRAVPNYTKGA